MNREAYVELLRERTSLFLQYIGKELEKKHSNLFEDFGFPFLNFSSNDFHEQVYYQSYLESYTRTMINGILRQIIEDEGFEMKWPEFEFFGIYRGYTNKEYESEFGFEFIDTFEKIGYRYTILYADEVDDFLNKGNVDKIVIVEWLDEWDTPGYGYPDNPVQVISSQELFHIIYEESEDTEEIDERFRLFIKYVSEAVKKARELISLKTIPGFTPAYIHDFKQDILAELEEKIKSLESFSISAKKYKYVEENSKKLVTDYHIPQSFLNRKLHYALVGESKASKSFLTSEYLYRYFKQNPMFDYTPIVSGYMKSVEQLLHDLCFYFNGCHDVGKGTMGDYNFFIKNNCQILDAEYRSVVEIIFKCLDSYRVADRNSLFHKHSFDDWAKVVKIRNNTIFLLTVLLGAADQTLLSHNEKILGLLNYKYEDLFVQLDDFDGGCFHIIFDDRELVDMSKKKRDEALEYDNNGLIINKIRFEKYDDYNECVTDILEISPDSMPKEIWCGKGMSRKRIW